MTRIAAPIHLPILVVCLLTALALFSTGCQTANDGPTPEATLLPDPAAGGDLLLDEPAAGATRASAVTTSPGSVRFAGIPLEMTKTARAGFLAGEPFVYEISVTAQEDVTNVVVLEELPDGVRFVSSDPQGQEVGDGSSRRWQFPALLRDQNRRIQVTIIPEREGRFETCTTFSAETTLCLPFSAGAPRIFLSKTGPSTVELGEISTWRITIRNDGSAPAKNVTITDELPEIFEPTTPLTFDIPELAPGQQRVFEVRGRALRTGDFENKVSATWDGPQGRDGTAGITSAVSDLVPGTVLQSVVSVEQVGPAETFVLKPGRYSYTVVNKGDTTLQDVRVTNRLPAGASVVEAGGGRYSQPENTIVWTIPSLPPKESRSFNARFFSSRPGATENVVRVTTSRGLSDEDRLTTNWKPVPGVQIEIADSKDPLRVGEETIYTVRVVNQGEFQPVGATVKVVLTENLKPIAFSGRSSESGRIDGQTITFDEVSIQPGQDLLLRIRAKGEAPGQGSARLEFQADFLNQPYISEEPTNVF